MINNTDCPRIDDIEKLIFIKRLINEWCILPDSDAKINKLYILESIEKDYEQKIINFQLLAPEPMDRNYQE